MFSLAFREQNQRGAAQTADGRQRGKNEEGLPGSKDQNQPAKQ